MILTTRCNKNGESLVLLWEMENGKFRLFFLFSVKPGVCISTTTIDSITNGIFNTLREA